MAAVVVRTVSPRAKPVEVDQSDLTPTAPYQRAVLNWRDLMASIYSNITETTGRTPLVELQRITPPGGARVIAKLESFNPLSSVKDRIGVNMINVAEAEGRITPGKTTLVEPTSRNTGISLPFASAAKGYRLVLTK